jgi:tripartite-type tricarboxylate transporter receptor subunit TctC
VQGGFVKTFLLAVVLVLAFAQPPRAFAQDAWPSRPIRLVVPFPPGGNTDVVARIAAGFLQHSITGSTVVVENRAGAGGIVGAEAVAKAAGDGHTLCVCSMGAITVAPSVERLPYDPLADLVPISLVNTNPLVLLVHPSVAARSPQELVALSRAAPGRLHYSSGGIGGLNYFSAELFKAMTGADLTHVPYRGGSPATTALVAGEVQLSFANMSDAVAQIEAGSLRALGVTTAARSPALPQMPTLAEQGIAGYNIESWNGLFAPRGTPRAVVERLARVAADMAADDAIRLRMLGFGSVAVANTPEAFSQRLLDETAHWARVVAAIGVR